MMFKKQACLAVSIYRVVMIIPVYIGFTTKFHKSSVSIPSRNPRQHPATQSVKYGQVVS